MPKLFVISLGGSLIAPEGIDARYLKKFRQLIIARSKKNSRFIISPGGGKTCRNYQQALRAIIPATGEDLDAIGLNTNRFHAVLLRLMFKNLAEKNIAYDPNKRITFNKKILVGAGGWKPGRSSDDFSVRLAKIYGAKTIINLSNIDFVYDKDPRKFKDAKKLPRLSWNEFLKITGSEWKPGANVPFDPTAAKLAKKHGISVIIANGKNLSNIKNILAGKKFQGTVIE
jgi:uridylate kinase